MISMVGILASATTIMLALVLLVFGNVIDEYIQSTYPFYKIISIIWNVCRYFFIIIIMIFIFIGIYRFAPAKRLFWRDVLPGSIFSTIGWIVLSFVFSFYIDNFNNYARFYGSLGAGFILMTWLFLISVIFILGVEINYVITELKHKIYSFR